MVDVAHDHHHGGRGSRSSSLSSAVSMSRSSMVTMTSFSTLQPSSSAMMAAVSKSMTSLREAMTPFFIRVLTTSAPVFFMREASSPTPMASGLRQSAESFWRSPVGAGASSPAPPGGGLLPWKPPLRWLRPWNFCLPACICLVLPAARFSSRSSYFSRFTWPPLRASTTFFSGTRVAGRFAGCWAGCALALGLLGRGPARRRGGLLRLGRGLGGLPLGGRGSLGLPVDLSVDALDVVHLVVLGQVLEDQGELPAPPAPAYGSWEPSHILSECRRSPWSSLLKSLATSCTRYLLFSK